MFQAQLQGKRVLSVQLKQFLHKDRPILTVHCLFKTKQERRVGVGRKEFMPGNENEFLQKPVLVVVSELKGLNCWFFISLCVCLWTFSSPENTEDKIAVIFY